MPEYDDDAEFKEPEQLQALAEALFQDAATPRHPAGQASMNDFTISTDREAIDVISIGRHVPFLDWTHTDPNGHQHEFTEEGELPTLEWTITGTDWCDECSEEHEEGEWRCRECGATVEPRYNWTGPTTEHIPGLPTYTLTATDGRQRQLTQDEYETLLGLPEPEMRELADQLLAEQ